MSLVEAALLLSVIGVVLAIFVPSFFRRVRSNKVSEAAELLQEMSTRSMAYYAAPQATGYRNCLPPSAGPTPATPSVDSAEVDFFSTEEPGHASWRAFEFQPQRPIRYSYSYQPSVEGCDLGAANPTLVFRAEGDLDGDGVRSTFERRVTLRPDGSAEADSFHVHQRIE